MTYIILIDETRKIIHCSHVRSAEDPKTINLHAHKWGEDDYVPHESHIDESPSVEDKTNANSAIALINLEYFIGKSFPVVDDQDNKENIIIVDILEKYQNNTVENPEHVKFWIQRNTSDYEDIIAYNDLMNAIEDNGETKIIWEFRRIKGHQGPLNKNHSNYKGSSYNVTIEWENGGVADEPLSIIAVDDLIVRAKYTKKNNLL